MAVLSFFGFFVTYMLRVNINVAIVAMVNASHEIGANDSIAALQMVNEDTCFSHFSAPSGNQTSTENEVEAVKIKEFVEGSFVWDEKLQGSILSAFYYGYFITQIPGGIIAAMFGPKWIFGFGLLLTSILTIFTHLAAEAGPTVVMGLRFVEGLGEGVLFPAMHALLGKWIPPMERSKLPAFIFAGYYVGTVATFSLSGFLAGSDWKWPSIFYISGGIGCVWFVLWFVFASDSPECHKWISDKEKNYIVRSIKADRSKTDVHHGLCQTPWMSIAKSIPVYAIAISSFAHDYGFYTILIYLPIYLRNIMGYSIEQNGVLSALPYLLALGSQIISSWIADFVRVKGWLSTTSVRKILGCSATFIHAVCLLVATLVGCNREAVLGLLMIGSAAESLMNSSFAVNHLDIAPIYAGELMGITNCISNVSGFLVPTVVGIITEDNQTLTAWSKVFYIAAALEIIATVFYATFASGEVQPWAREISARNVSTDDVDDEMANESFLTVGKKDNLC